VSARAGGAALHARAGQAGTHPCRGGPRGHRGPLQHAQSASRLSEREREGGGGWWTHSRRWKGRCLPTAKKKLRIVTLFLNWGLATEDGPRTRDFRVVRVALGSGYTPGGVGSAGVGKGRVRAHRPPESNVYDSQPVVAHPASGVVLGAVFGEHDGGDGQRDGQGVPPHG
jgi:hypothetical protein